MLGDLISKIDLLKRESLSLIDKLPIIELNDDEQKVFEAFFERQGLKSICKSQSFQVETSENHWAVCSNQYLALAAIGYEFAMCLKNYFDFLDKSIRPNKEQTDIILDLQKREFNKLDDIDQWLRLKKSRPYIEHVSEYPDDKASLCYFLAGLGVKKFGNDKLRGTGDLFGSYVLAIYPVTTVASGFLGGLIYALCQDENVFEKITFAFKSAKERCEENSVDYKEDEFKSPSFTPSQIIYYGVPGCGKSNKIKDLLRGVPDERKERVVFHPEYTHADFVGQILPVVHDGVDYKFTPGPFTKMVAKAYKSLASENPEQFYLVIEEINRGNAAAIFGDVFQLLDRIKPGESDSSLGNGSVYTEGWSQYFVYNEDINSKVLELAEAVELKMGSVTFTKDSGIRLPPNLSIYATMNTSDQNVFTLDNAFQRRWDMELVSNTCDWNDKDHKNQAKSKIGDTDICWETFREIVNNEISGGDFFNAEDKQLGPFFIEAEDDKIDGKKFANKVLKYLWADVFKRDTGKIFKSENLSKVVEDFTGTDAFNKVFVEDFVQSLKNSNDEIKNHE